MAGLSVTHAAPFAFTRGVSDAREPETVAVPRFPGTPGPGQPTVVVGIDGQVQTQAPGDGKFSVSDWGFTTATLAVGGAVLAQADSEPVPFPQVTDEQTGISYYSLAKGTSSTASPSGSNQVHGSVAAYLGSGTTDLPVFGYSQWRQGSGPQAGISFLTDEGVATTGAPTTATGTVTVTYAVAGPHDQDLEAVTPRLEGAAAEPFGPPPVLLPPGQGAGAPVGTVQGVEGEVLIQRADGTVVPATPGTPIYRNDTVETFADGRAEIGFVDNSAITVERDARLGIDEYVYDPDPGAGSVSFLRSLFLFTGGLVGERQSIDENSPIGGTGRRGSAEEIIRNDLLSNPEPALGTVGIWMETASPKTVWTFVELPDGPVTFSFDYAFLAAGSTLTASLGGRAIWQVEAGDVPLGTLQSVEMVLEWQAILTSLAFTVDGPEAGLGVLLLDARLGDATLTHSNDWYGEGGGAAEFAWVTTEAQLAELHALLLADDPPADDPPADDPPVDEPPVDEPPVDEPPVNEAPIAANDTASTGAGTAVVIDVLVNDADPDGALVPGTVTITGPGQKGTAVANPDGTVTYTPDPGAAGDDSFRYTVADDQGAVSNEATVEVTIVAAPPPPQPDPAPRPDQSSGGSGGAMTMPAGLGLAGGLSFRLGTALALDVALDAGAGGGRAEATAAVGFGLAGGAVTLAHQLATTGPGPLRLGDVLALDDGFVAGHAAGGSGGFAQAAAAGQAGVGGFAGWSLPAALDTLVAEPAAT